VAARWSGTPLGVPLHPVQAYAALGSLTIGLATVVCLSLALKSSKGRAGDVTGGWLIANGVLLFLTEIFRDWEGRGVLMRGSVDAEQLVALGMVLLGGLQLTDLRQRFARKVTHV
jgi:phosphatidylglycerol:prolipoprotein diacylglycerol transferase